MLWRRWALRHDPHQNHRAAVCARSTSRPSLSTWPLDDVCARRPVRSPPWPHDRGTLAGGRANGWPPLHEPGRCVIAAVTDTHCCHERSTLRWRHEGDVHASRSADSAAGAVCAVARAMLSTGRCIAMRIESSSDRVEATASLAAPEPPWLQIKQRLAVDGDGAVQASPRNWASTVALHIL